MYKQIHISIFFLLLIFSAYSATRTWSGAGGNSVWNNTANWTCACVPSTGDDIVISTLTINMPTVTSTDYNAFNPKDVTIDLGATITFNHTGNNIFAFTGNWVNNGTLVHTSGYIAAAGTGAQSIGGTSTNNFFRLAQTGTGTTTLAADITVSSAFGASAGTFSTSTYSMSGTAAFLGSGGTVRFGTLGVTVPEITGAYSWFGLVLVVFDGAGAQTIRGGKTYSSILTGGTGAKTISGGNVTLEIGAWVQSGGSTLNAGANTITSNGTAWILDGSFVPGTGTVDFVGNTTITGTVDPVFNNLTITGGLTLVASDTTTISGNLVNNGTFNSNNGTIIFNGTTTISGASNTLLNKIVITGSLTGPSANYLGIAGDWINNGTTYNHNNGLVSMYGTTTISGSSTTLFHDLEIIGTVTGHSTLMRMAGDWINTGTYNHNNGRVTFTDISTVSGSSITNFYNIDIGVSVIIPIAPKNTLTGHASSMIVSGTWRKYHANNIYVHNSGKVIFNGSAAQTIGGNTATTFSRVQKDSSNTLTLAIAATVADSLLLNGGILDDGGFSLNGAGTLLMTNTAELHLAETGTTLPATTVIVSGSFGTNTLVRLYGNGAQTLKAARYGDLIIDGNSNTTLAGNISCQDLVIDDATSVLDVTASNRSIVCQADWTNNGTFIPQNGFVRISGASVHTLNGSSGTSFYDLQVFSSADLELGVNISVSNNLSMTSGTLDLKDYDVDLGSTGTLVGETSTNRVKATNGIGTEGQGTGTIYTTRDIGTPSALNVAGLGAELTTAFDVGNTTIIRSHLVQGGSGTFTGNESIYRSYTITPSSNSGLNATLRFYYFDSELNGHTEANLELYKWYNIGAGYWIVQGATTRDGTANYVELTGIDGFSLWTMGSTGIPLPIELGSFWVEKEEKTVNILWTTYSEQNNDYFGIERSSDGKFFHTIGTRKAIGNSTEQVNYTFIDDSPLSGLSYYRLKQVDKDGHTETFKVVSVYYDAKEGNRFMVLNNITSENITVLFNKSPETNDQMILYNSSGSQIALYNLNPDDQSLYFGDPGLFAPGVYYILYKGNNYSQVERTVVY